MSSTSIEIPTARIFRPLLEPSRYKGAFGGRGSGKSHFFAELAVERCLIKSGSRILCARELQKSLKESAKLLIEDKIKALDAPGFRILNDEIVTPGGGLIVFQGLSKHTADTIKSYEGFDVAWVEEAHRLTQTSLQLLRPTIRKPESELWFSWNPTRKTDAIDMLLRGDHPPEDALVVRANWSDNPWFPKELEADRLYDLKYSPSYRHVWEGEYASVIEGAYFAKHLTDARAEGRITELAYDPILDKQAFWDLGYSDSTAIWIAQFGQTIKVMDYIEGQGQELSYYVNALRDKGLSNCLCVLPHDGAQHHTGPSAEQHLKQAGFRTKLVANQGRGAAMRRVEAARRLFPRIWFNTTTAPGLEALGAYHERRDEQRGVGLGPEHDWSSDAADAFGLMCVVYEEPKIRRADAAPQRIVERANAGTDWLGN